MEMNYDLLYYKIEKSWYNAIVMTKARLLIFPMMKRMNDIVQV